MEMITIIVGIAAFIIGAVVSKIVFGKSAEKERAQVLRDAQEKSEQILAEAREKAENIKQKKILEAKEKFLALKEKSEIQFKSKQRKIQSQEDRLKNQNAQLSKQIEASKRKEKEFESKRADLKKQMEVIAKRKEDLEKAHKKSVILLEEISGLSAGEAKKQLLVELRNEAKALASVQTQEIIDEAKLKANQEARKIVVQTIQRVATEEAVENSVSVFPIENDDIKGRIIGREGRNIRAIEAATGVEIIIDDTPEAIILSCFDPVRREVARLSLHQLVTDGRIHPARVEEVVKKIKRNIENEIMEVGKRTCIDLGIHNLHSELVKMVGRMKYRSSYGQNLLQHSREVANLSATMAAELGLNAKAAKRAGLLHDIGKVPEDESELPHALLGMKIAEKYGEKPDILNAIGAHHDEIEMTTLLSPIIQVCDAISGARPGARREVVEAYIQRLKNLENIALDQPGVTKSYAIQAGRELRVIVESEKVTDDMAAQISFDISQRIQTEMTYPGQVKVTVIRETRAVNYAR